MRLRGARLEHVATPELGKWWGGQATLDEASNPHPSLSPSPNPYPNPNPTLTLTLTLILTFSMGGLALGAP